MDIRWYCELLYVLYIHHRCRSNPKKWFHQVSCHVDVPKCIRSLRLRQCQFTGIKSNFCTYLQRVLPQVSPPYLLQAPKGTRTWGGIQNQVAENKIDYCTFLHKFFKVSLPYWSLNAHQPRAEYEFGSQVIKLIVVPIIVQHLFLTRVLLQVSLLEGFAGQLYEKGRQRHPNMKFHALFQYICFLFILESLLSK